MPARPRISLENVIRRTMRMGAMAIACGISSLAAAHHSIGLIEITAPTWVTATVVRYEARHPHVLLYLEGRDPEGRPRLWTVEGPIMARLARMQLARDFVRPGDTVEVCGFPYKNERPAHGRTSPRESPSRPHLHAMLLVLRDGTRQAWGPYGRLQNCLRPEDSHRSWAESIDNAPMLREYWCKGLKYHPPGPAGARAVEDVNQHLKHRCG